MGINRLKDVQIKSALSTTKADLEARSQCEYPRILVVACSAAAVVGGGGPFKAEDLGFRDHFILRPGGREKMASPTGAAHMVLTLAVYERSSLTDLAPCAGSAKQTLHVAVTSYQYGDGGWGFFAAGERLPNVASLGALPDTWTNVHGLRRAYAHALNSVIPLPDRDGQKAAPDLVTGMTYGRTPLPENELVNRLFVGRSVNAVTADRETATRRVPGRSRKPLVYTTQFGSVTWPGDTSPDLVIRNF